MRSWGIGAVVLLAAWAAGCGGNSTPVGITVSPTPETVLLNSSVQFSASVSGASTTTVYWQVCLPATSTTTLNPPPITTKPTDCTPIPGITTPKGNTVLTGYGVIQQTGLYTAPAVLPTPNQAVILVTSTIDPTAFATVNLTIDSGIRVQVTPLTAIISPTETFQFTANVTGPTTDRGVSWTLSQSGTTNPPPLGTISSGGLYTAPATSPGTVIVTATSSADPTQSGSATVTVGAGAAITLTNLDPSVAAQGSAQQDVYLTGTGFESTSQVVVTAPGQLPLTLPQSSVFFLSATLARVTLPASVLSAAGSTTIQVQSTTVPSNVSGVLPLSVFPVRPALVAVMPQNVAQNLAGASVDLIGGYFSGATTTTLNGATVGAVLNSSRELSAAIPGGVLSIPGLYPIVVQNSGVEAGQSPLSALNIAVTPVQSTIPGAPNGGTIGVGTNPTAVAIDEADGIAVVANAGSNNVTLVNIATSGVLATIGVGVDPTGVAVDDLLANPVALVVNSGDQTVTAIDLITHNTTKLSVPIQTGTAPPPPYAIGVNPLTHRAIVAYESASLAMILDVSDSGGITGAPVLTEVQTIGGSQSNYTGTGATPAIAIDPRLNWAVVTPGGAGEVNVVDLGTDSSPGQPQGRIPYGVADLLLTQTVQGVGINGETHQAFLSDPNSGTLFTFSMLDNSVKAVTEPSMGGLPGSGAPLNQAGFGAAAASSLEDVGIAVNANSTAVVVDLSSGVVLQTVGGLGTSVEAQAVAVDPVSNQAFVVNHEASSVSVVSLGTSLDSLQIVEASPAIVFGGPGAANTTLTIVGGGFIGGTSEVLLDGAPLPGGDVNVVSARKIIATVPGSMLDSARRYIVQVRNGATTSSPVSNVTDMSVIQPVSVGSLPVGVAIDTDRDLAVTTNSGDGTVSLISLAPVSSESPLSLGNVGAIGSPVLVGTTPEGVAVMPRLGLAVVANNGSNNASVVDVTGEQVPVTVSVCANGGCSSPVGVGVNQDTGQAAVTATNPTSAVSTGTLAVFGLPATTATAASALSVDHDPVAVAVDPNLDYAAVATASQASSINIINMSTFATAGTLNGALENPGGIIFDPVNQVFLTANTLLNDILLVDPTSFAETPVNVGIAPTSLDYNYQTSTLVTANSPSGTLSVLDYVCPPGAGAPAACVGPSVQTVLGLGGTQTSPLVLGPSAVAIDPKLNLAVLVDPDNSRVLLVPLPH